MAGRAYANDPGAVPKCFFALGTDHGGVWGRNMYPDDGILNQQMDYAGRTVRYGALPTGVDPAGNISLSPMCTARALTPNLVSKFNILRGVDIPYVIGHHSGGHLGAFGITTNGAIDGLDASRVRCPTIDQVIAWSPCFYGPDDLAQAMTQRSFSVVEGRLSWSYASPTTQSGALVPANHQRNNQAFHRYLFAPGTAYNNIDTLVIDRIKSSFARLRRHPRLSRGDGMRLDQHVERMFEIERKLQVVAQMAAPPQLPEGDTNDQTAHHTFSHNPGLQAAYWGLMNDIIVAAFETGTSRVGTCLQTHKFTEETVNDWHGQVAHGALGGEAAQRWVLGWNQGTFENVMVDLAAKMDAVNMADGTTLLDNSLLMFSQEAGQVTHHTGVVNYPIVTAGSAGGFFNTGMFVDFTNQDITYDDLREISAELPGIQLEHPGLYYNQFLANVLQSMGLPPQEYEGFRDFRSGEPVPGYGLHHITPQRADHYTEARRVMGDLLPVITGNG